MSSTKPTSSAGGVSASSMSSTRLKSAHLVERLPFSVIG